MSPFIRIFVPDSHRTNYWVTLFLLNGSSPEVHEAETEEQAEALASRLAQQHNCKYKFMPPRDDNEWKHWWTNDGKLRRINRVEFVSLGGGLFQFNLWSDSVRLHVEAGRVREIGWFLEETVELMKQQRTDS